MPTARLLTFATAAAFAGAPAFAARPTESLDRGLVALPADDGSLFLSWRLLASDPEGTAFDVLRLDGTSETTLNQEPLEHATSFTTDRAPGTYAVRPVGGTATPAVTPWADPYLEIPISPIEGYRPCDASAADLDGDGDYEIVLHQVSGSRDNSHPGITGTPVLDAYTLEGEHLWRIDLGINIREGEHYTQFIAFDFDGDGRAEVACKTADGSKDGTGKVIGDATKDYRIRAAGDLKDGRILEGPEFLTVFDGLTGAALATTDYVPARDPLGGWGGIGGNGKTDSYGNRSDRFLACAAYLDGERPSLVMCRGVYGRTVLAAWDWRDGTLEQRWVFDSGISYPPFEDASPYSGMGGHSLAVADVDADGKDEIVYQAMVVDDDGTGLHSSGLRHGDAMHVSDLDPARPGLEIFTVTENEDHTVRFGTPGAALRDAASGEIIWSHSPGVDVRNGLAADIDPRHPGAEVWGNIGGLRAVSGEPIGPAPRTNHFAIWWDGDRLRELLSGGRVSKWNWRDGREEPLFTADTRRRLRYPTLSADLVGDWREEILVPSPDGLALRLYSTTIPTDHRLVTLMQDPQYRLAIATQNVVYNAPPHVSFFLGENAGDPE